MKKIYMLNFTLRAPLGKITAFNVLLEDANGYVVSNCETSTRYVILKPRGHRPCPYSIHTSYAAALTKKRRFLRARLKIANLCIERYAAIRRRLLAEIKATYKSRRNRNKKRGGEL